MNQRQNLKKNDVTASYAEAKEHILAAIHILGSEALNGDSLAKDSISNLSVVLLDLKK